MYQGWLSLGGNEIVSAPRARGIAESASCPVSWFKGPDCLTLRDALGETNPYLHQFVSDAPWYDPSLPEVSSRFYGAYGISVRNVVDGTRQAGITEGITDGGTIGRQRDAVREIVVRAMLAARGTDALDYGMAWLDAALDPGACGQHSEECGLTDLEFFADCPPPRVMVPDYTDWAETAENIVTNPAMVTDDPATEMWRNLATNPSFETPGTTTTLLAQNMHSNPSFETLGAGTIVVRTNLNTNPRMENSSTGWSVLNGGQISFTPNGARLDWLSGTASPDLPLFQQTVVASLPAGDYLTGSLDITVPVGAPAISLYLAAVSTGAVATAPGPTVTINPGETRRLSTGAVLAPTGSAGGRTVIYSPNALAPGAHFVVTRAIMERSAAVGSYFDGTFPAEGDFTYAWTGTAGNSTSTIRGLQVNGSSGTQAAAYSSTEWAALGTKSLRITPNYRDSTGGRALLRSAFSAVAGDTFLVEATLRLAAPLTGTLGPLALCLVATIAGTTPVDIAGPSIPNVAGAHVCRFTFTVPPGGTSVAMYAFPGSSPGNGDMWVDKVLLVKNNTYNGSYFDGDTRPPEATADENVSWASTPHASVSNLGWQSVAGLPLADSTANRYLTADAPVKGTKAARWQLTTSGALRLPIIPIVNTPAGVLHTIYGKVRAKTRTQTFIPQIRGATGPAFTAPVGEWTEFRLSTVAGSGVEGTTGLALTTTDGHQIGDLIDIDTVVVVAGAYPGLYFDGETSPDPAFTPAWIGTAQASQSVLRAVPVTGVAVRAGHGVQYKTADGVRYVATSTSYGEIGFATTGVNALGPTATILLRARASAPRSASLRIGTDPAASVLIDLTTEFQTFTATVTRGDAPTVLDTGLVIPNQVGGEHIDIEHVLVADGGYFGGYFDGSTPGLVDEHGEEVANYSWAGTANASTSIQESRNLYTRLQTDEEYAAVVNPLYRYFHGVAAISGPHILEEFEAYGANGYVVEFVLAASRPWVFSRTMELDLPPSLPEVVQDVPYNLAIFPSAEAVVPGATVAVATNFATNPSVEVDATGWSTYYDSLQILPANLVGARSTELAAHGTASYKVLFTAPATSAIAGSFGSQTLTNLTLTENTRVSINLWASASVQSGTAVLNRIRFIAHWQSATAQELRADVLGTLAPTGGAVSVKSIAPPPGTARVMVQAIADLTSWSAAAQVRIYTDALAVTVP